MNRNQIRILLIEDDPDDVLLLRGALNNVTTVRFQVLHADHLSMGLERIKEDEFDVVLLDLNLPDSQGLETLDELVSLDREVPIVVVSGLGDETILIKNRFCEKRIVG